MNILRDLLKMWHPFVPFVTETIWREMSEKESIMISSWPTSEKKFVDKKTEQEFEAVQQLIILIRNARAQYNIPYSRELEVVVAVDKKPELVERVSTIVKQITKLGELRTVKVKKASEFSCPAGFVSAGVFALGNVFVNVHGAIDLEKEGIKLKREQDNLNTFIVQLEKKLKNEQFVKNAPAKVVENERAKLTEAHEKLAKTKNQLKRLL
jgi:valyl-tRNA synthetase